MPTNDFRRFFRNSITDVERRFIPALSSLFPSPCPSLGESSSSAISSSTCEPTANPVKLEHKGSACSTGCWPAWLPPGSPPAASPSLRAWRSELMMVVVLEMMVEATYATSARRDASLYPTMVPTSVAFAMNQCIMQTSASARSSAIICCIHGACSVILWQRAGGRWRRARRAVPSTRTTPPGRGCIEMVLCFYGIL